MLILAQQAYGMGWVLVMMLVILGLLAICIPRPRKMFKKPEMKKVRYKRPRLQ